MWNCNMCNKEGACKNKMYFWGLEGERYQEEICYKCNKILLQQKKLEEQCRKFKEQLARRGANSNRYFDSLKEEKEVCAKRNG